MATYTSQPDETDGVDTWIDSANVTTNYGTAANLIVGESDAAAGTGRTLIFFDLSTIPKNSTVTSATLSLWTEMDRSANARTFYVYRQLKEWWEPTATWSIWGNGNWATAGGFDSSDCETTDIGSCAFTATETTDTEKQFSLDPAKVQEWVDGTLTNNGMLIKADTELSDQYGFHSSASATAGFRPKLVIVYTPLGNVTTLPATVDTYISSTDPTVNYGAATTFTVGEGFGSTAIYRGLIKFDLSLIPPGATINRARVRMVTQGESSNEPNLTMYFYRQLKAWVEGEATWNIYSTGNAWATAGGFDSSDCETTDIGSRTFNAVEINGRYVFLELTASKIKEMIDGTLTNNGFLLKTFAEADDAVIFHSSESATTSYQPILYVDWSGGGQVMIWESD